MTVDIWRMIGFMGAVFDFKDGTFTVPNFQNMMTFRTQAVSTLEEGESSSSGPLTPRKAWFTRAFTINYTFEMPYSNSLYQHKLRHRVLRD